PLGLDGPRLIPGLGGAIVVGEVDGEVRRARRDLDLEAENLDSLLMLPGACTAEPAGERWYLEGLPECLDFLEALRKIGTEVYWPDGAELKLRRTVGAKDLRLSIKTIDQWFEASGELQVDDDCVLSLSELLQAILRDKGRFIKLADGSLLALESRLRRALDALALAVQKQAKSLVVHRLATLGLETLVDEAKTSCDDGFSAHLRRFDSLPEAVAIPVDLRTNLRGYQEDAFQWLVRLAHLGAGGILADDMGLGKTIVTLALLLHRRHEGPTLVVVPTSIVGNWIREMGRFAPSLTPLALGRTANRADLVLEAGAGDVVICTYGLLVVEEELLRCRKWSTVIFDESQALKNPVTQRHKAALKINADLRLSLTGTPIENHLGEIHTQFAILNPGMLGGKSNFRDRFQRPIELGDRAVAHQLKKLVAPYLLRRTKDQVLDELPSRTDIDVPVSLGPEETSLYEAQRLAALAELQAGPASAVHVLAQLTKLRLLACSPRLVVPDFSVPGAKLRVFGEIVDNLIANGHRALVFSQFVKHLTLLREWLDEKKISYQYLDGSTPAVRRDRVVETFQEGEDPLFLISTRAGGQGLNLTGADYVVHMDPWWNPAVEDQASD
ncbi:MAG: ATP-dependent helicase, partial [Proteobacteria bacterium]|nr:ATP-dependent helicase [Pseudomonadota bacterium]